MIACAVPLAEQVVPGISSEDLTEFWQGEVLWDCSMAQFSTFKTGGSARAVVFPHTVEELIVLVRGLCQKKIFWKAIGRGSNILVRDEGFSGVVIMFGRDFSAIEKISESEKTVSVRVESGCSLARLLNWCLEQELSGLEFVTGIPGSIGGSVVMNAGAGGEDISGVLHSVTIMDPQGEVIEILR
ncbi:FAD-binding protein, partial [Thermodesulfobacteriota bacterium]